MFEKFQNKQGGFLRLIILIVIMFLLMTYFEVTFSDMWNMLKEIFGRFF